MGWLLRLNMRMLHPPHQRSSAAGSLWRGHTPSPPSCVCLPHTSSVPSDLAHYAVRQASRGPWLPHGAACALDCACFTCAMGASSKSWRVNESCEVSGLCAPALLWCRDFLCGQPVSLGRAYAAPDVVHVPNRRKTEGFAGGWLPAVVLRAVRAGAAWADVRYDEARGVWRARAWPCAVEPSCLRP